MQKQIQSSQCIIKEVNKIKASKTIAKIKNFMYDHDSEVGKMYIKDTKIKVEFRWEKKRGFDFLSFEYFDEDINGVYYGSYLELMKTPAT